MAGNVEPQGPSKLPSSRGENGELGTIGTTSRVQFLSFSITCISCFSLFLQGADEPKGPPGLLDQMTVITHWYSLIVTTLNIISWNNINALTTAILMCN